MSPDIARRRAVHESRTGGAKEEGDEVRNERHHHEDFGVVVSRPVSKRLRPVMDGDGCAHG